MKKSKKRVIPGFGLTMGVTITMLSIIVLIPLASLVVYSSQLGLKEFFEVITRKRVLSSFYVSFITALGASLVNAVMGLILAWARRRATSTVYGTVTHRMCSSGNTSIVIPACSIRTRCAVQRRRSSGSMISRPSARTGT